MAKRPSGFGKASKLKKQKTEEKVEVGPDSLEEEPAVNIELRDEIDDDELAEVYGLYSKLREERDPRLARGLVHESDQLLRSRDAENKSLPAKFHVAYGAALLTLGDPESGEKDTVELGNAGINRLDVGLEMLGETDDELRAVAAAELIQFVHTQIVEATISKSNKKTLRKAQKLLGAAGANLEVAKALYLLVQLTDDLPDEQETLELAKKLLEKQLKSSDLETKRTAHEALGQYYLNVVAPAMDALDDDEDDDGYNDEPANESIKNDLKAALDHLKQAVTETKPTTLVMLAETLLQWANFVDEGEEQKTYAEALKYLKRAQMLGADDLREVIESLENPDESE